MSNTDEILRKYGSKIESQIETSQSLSQSSEYLKFKEDLLPVPSKYQRWCLALGNLVKVRLSPKEEAKIQKHLDRAHLDVTPSQTLTLAIFSFILIFTSVVLITLAVYFINNSLQLLFLILGAIASIFVFYYTYTLPQRLANAWRLKASSQMVPAILYIVVYMKHTSNLEKAIEFASQHL